MVTTKVNAPVARKSWFKMVEEEEDRHTSSEEDCDELDIFVDIDPNLDSNKVNNILVLSRAPTVDYS